MVRLTVLGSGDAFGSGGRAHSSYLIAAPGACLLLDCGPAVLQALKRDGIDPGAIDAVLLSHLHGDHFGGVPFLLMEYLYERPRTRPLVIYGPPGTRPRVQGLFEALYEHSARETLPFRLDFVEMTSGKAIPVGTARVLPFRVPHAAELVCLGLRVEVGGRSVLYSGDSGWTDEFVTHSRDVDVFLCECSNFEDRMPGFHLSYREIAARAADFGCRRLVLTHLGSEPLARQDEIAIECARDGMTIEL